MIDFNTGTYWMGPPLKNKIQIQLDLGKNYNVYDIFIWFGLKPQGFYVWCSAHNFYVNEFERLMSSTEVWGRMRLLVRGTPFKMRYLRVDLHKSYVDEEGKLGTSIRDIAIYQFRNLAEGRPSGASNTWSYPPSRITDSDTTNWWMSKFGAAQADLIFDLGSDKNIAGVDVKFKYLARYFTFSYAPESAGLTNTTPWKLIILKNGNYDLDVTFPSTGSHFKGRYIKMHMKFPYTKIFHPDLPADLAKQDYVFAIQQVKFWEHTGGGGVVGIQNLDGTEFNTIVWGQRQPGEWMVGSENDVFTKEVGGGVFQEDQGNPVHIVMTIATVERQTDLRKIKMALYRNGVAYGDPWHIYEPITKRRLRDAYQTRMVFGVRSTVYTNDTSKGWQLHKSNWDCGTSRATDYSGLTLSQCLVFCSGYSYAANWSSGLVACRCYDVCGAGQATDVAGGYTNEVHVQIAGIAGTHSLTHSPYFWGKIYNVTLIQNALSPEEVMGLYAAHRSLGAELGCHCYDACPVGFNRFNKTVPVPCSGQGICLRNAVGQPLGPGTCQCLPGFSGKDCSQHCSDLSQYGCCKIDDDCPSWSFCNTAEQACHNVSKPG
jgi:hypothetical protein